MTQVIVRLSFWSLAYLSVCLLPLIVALAFPQPERRPLLIELGVALGMIGYVMLALQFLSTGRLRWITPFFGSDAQVSFHRTTGIVSLAFIFLHPTVLISADQEFLKYFDPTENFLRALFLTAASIGLILVVVLSVWRVAIGLSYEWWLLTHGLLACGVLLVGLAHALQVGHYVGEPGNQIVFVVLAISALGVFGYVRLLKPFRLRRSPWKVVQVDIDCPEVYRLVLEAVGHNGLAFTAGQYVWLTIGNTYFPSQQHPFSVMSSERQTSRLEFGIKALGDFTKSLQAVELGTPAYVDGPHGAFISDPQAQATLCIVAGIGVTPVLSILRTARDQSDHRPYRMLYANSSHQEIPFKRELDGLAQELDLKVVHVLEQLPNHIQGESGMLDGAMIQRHFEQMNATDTQCFVCGPIPVIDIAERALHGLGVPLYRVISERFDLV